jgi:hypothetical protein
MELLMLTRRRFLTCCAGTWVGSLPMVEDLVHAQQAKVRLVMVVARESPLEALDMRDLKHLYRSDITEGPRGEQLIPIAQPVSSPDRIGFDQTVLGMSPAEMGRYWIDRKIRGQSGPPKAIGPSGLLQQVVRSLPGALGYVRANEVRQDVKVLRINGFGPNDDGYPLVY